MAKINDLTKCLFTGCKKPIAFNVEPLFDAPKFCTCAKHKPDIMKRPKSQRHFPFHYIVTPINKNTHETN